MNLWHSYWRIMVLMCGSPTLVGLDLATGTHHLVPVIRFSSILLQYFPSLCETSWNFCIKHFILVSLAGLLGLVMGWIGCLWSPCCIPVCAWPNRTKTSLCRAFLGEDLHLVTFTLFYDIICHWGIFLDTQEVKLRKKNWSVGNFDCFCCLFTRKVVEHDKSSCFA